jgi:hypothetical protein
MVNKRDVEVLIVCLSCHFDVGLFHVAGAKLTWESVVDVGASSSIPGNGARKRAACCVVNDQPVGNPKRKV